MNSSTSRTNERRETQDDIKRQIALLQARLEAEPEYEQEPLAPKPSPKRKAPPVTLVPGTPSPSEALTLDHLLWPLTTDLLEKKRRTGGFPSNSLPLAQPVFQQVANQDKPHTPSQGPKNRFEKDSEPKSNQSTFLSKLSGLGQKSDKKEPVQRTSGFQERPEERLDIVKRDDRLVVVEDLEPGPYEFKAPIDDPTFERLEPHSSIRLM